MASDREVAAGPRAVGKQRAVAKQQAAAGYQAATERRVVAGPQAVVGQGIGERQQMCERLGTSMDGNSSVRADSAVSPGSKGADAAGRLPSGKKVRKGSRVISRALAGSLAGALAFAGPGAVAAAQEAPAAPAAPEVEQQAPAADDGSTAGSGQDGTLPAVDPDANPNPDANPDQPNTSQPNQDQTPAATVPSQDSLSALGRENLQELSSCINTEKQADILLVIDESGSLKGDKGPATDPDNMRVDAAKDLVHQLGTVGKDLHADINVKLAGFGEGYRSDAGTYGEWTNTTDKPTALDSQIDGYASRNSDQYTEYEAALDGMLSEIGARQSPCKAVLWFTDGKLTVPGSAADDASAAQRVCEADGQLTRLRRSGIRVFTVGLTGENNQDDSPVDLLRKISEGSDGQCGAGTGNGAFFDAGTQAAALFSAFRSFVPGNGGTEGIQNMSDRFAFTLDNSVSPIRLSAQPQQIDKDHKFTPVLISPDGQKHPINSGDSTIGDVKVHAEEVTVNPGMVDVTMTLPEGKNWAGQWAFGYDSQEKLKGKYHVSVTLIPGLHVQAKELSKENNTGVGSDEKITSYLVDSNDKPRKLDGTATMKASIIPNDGSAPIDLVEGVDFTKGDQPVQVPLDKISKPVTGVLKYTVDITTKPADNAPGTKLAPIVTSLPISVSPASMPKLPNSVDVNLTEKEQKVTISVAGPGKVWVSPGTIEGATLPNGVDSIEINSDHNSQDSALELQRGEQKDLEVTLKSSSLADGPVSFAAPLQVEGEDGQRAAAQVQMNGSMSVPVNKTVFGAALAGALLLALLIPLAVLYLIRAVTARIPSRPGVLALAIPVSTDGTSITRTDKGGTFSLDFEEITERGQHSYPSAKSADVAGERLRVRTGWNPFTPARVVAESAPSIADSGRRDGDHASLPLAIQNHWFVVPDYQQSGVRTAGGGVNGAGGAGSAGAGFSAGGWGQGGGFGTSGGAMSGFGGQPFGAASEGSTENPGSTGERGASARLIVVVDDQVTRERLAAVVTEILAKGPDRVRKVADLERQRANAERLGLSEAGGGKGAGSGSGDGSGSGSSSRKGRGLGRSRAKSGRERREAENEQSGAPEQQNSAGAAGTGGWGSGSGFGDSSGAGSAGGFGSGSGSGSAGGWGSGNSAGGSGSGSGFGSGSAGGWGSGNSAGGSGSGSGWGTPSSGAGEQFGAGWNSNNGSNSPGWGHSWGSGSQNNGGAGSGWGPDGQDDGENRK